MEEFKNKAYCNSEPYKYPVAKLVSIVTPLYNREKEITRTLQSVANQTYSNIEHLIIDDGSTDNPDAAVFKYMNAVDYPVLYIKKKNGGAHTARNSGIAKARGEYTFLLDSDDELIATALTNLIDAWDEISEDKRCSYREVVGLCIDESGRLMGRPFPDGINSMEGKELQKALKYANGAHIALERTEAMKSCPWPEPEGVNFVAESLVWQQLNQKWKRAFLNKALYIYHTETPRSNTKEFNVKNTQNSINDLFRYQYICNHSADCGLTTKERLRTILLYTIFRQHLKSTSQLPKFDWTAQGLQKKTDRVLSSLMSVPAKILLKTILKPRFA